MDFSTIRSKLMGGDYDKESAWSELQQDMETMFTNAMTYNPAETFVHKQVLPIPSEDVLSAHPGGD